MDTKNIQLYRKLVQENEGVFSFSERKELREIIKKFLTNEKLINENPESFLSKKLEVSDIILREIGLGKAAVVSYLMMELAEKQLLEPSSIEKKFNISVNTIISGLQRVKGLYEKNASLETENFRKLLLTLAEDVRVILIIVAVRLQTMRNLADYPESEQQQIARESSFLYAPLAHRMGLYTIKTELEDLSLKFTNREIYKEIAKKLNETKRSRDQYISAFIEPLKEKMKETGFPFEIKGRTKSIHSIYTKIKKQNTTFENIYDLFAIRIIFDTPIEKEKASVENK